MSSVQSATRLMTHGTALHNHLVKRHASFTVAHYREESSVLCDTSSRHMSAWCWQELCPGQRWTQLCPWLAPAPISQSMAKLEAWREGRLPEGAGHYVAAASPLFQPVLLAELALVPISALENLVGHFTAQIVNAQTFSRSPGDAPEQRSMQIVGGALSSSTTTAEHFLHLNSAEQRNSAFAASESKAQCKQPFICLKLLAQILR